MEPMNVGAGSVFVTGGQIEIENQASHPRVNGHDEELVKRPMLQVFLSSSLPRSLVP